MAFHHLRTYLHDKKFNLNFIAFAIILLGVFCIGFSKSFWLNSSDIFYGKFLWLNSLNITFSTVFIFLGSLIFIILNKNKSKNENNAKSFIILILVLTLLILKKDPNIFNFSSLIIFILASQYFTNKHIKIILSCFLFTTGIQIALASIQLISQSSSNFGILSFLGEPELNQSTKSISKLNFSEQTILRPYGTTNHPNFLAGMILISILSLQKIKIQKQSIFFYLWGILITFSISSYIATILTFLNKKRTYFLFLTSALVILAAIKYVDPSYTGITDRIMQYSSISNWSPTVLEIFIGSNSEFIQNYQPYKILPWENQPIHNHFIYTLIQYGLIGFSLFLFLCYQTAKKNIKIFISLLPILLLDHYFLTIANGIILLGLVYLLLKKETAISS